MLPIGSCAERVREHLMSSGVAYSLSDHDPAFTAQELAAAEHVPGRMVAKTVILWAGGELVMAVVPATEWVDFDLAAAALDVPAVAMAREDEFADLFPDCERGAEPPFGALYEMRTYIDRTLATTGELVFHAGSHRRSMKMSTTDYMTAAKPDVVRLTA